MFKLKFLSPMLALATVLGYGCGDDENPVVPDEGKSNIRVIHSSYDAPAVDVAIDGQVAISSLDYTLSSGYASVDAGERAISVTPAGATDPVVIDATVTLDENVDYTVFAAGALSAIEPLVVVDDRTADATQARVRFAHLSPDAPAVDIKLNDGSGPAVFSNATFKDVSAYISVATGSYTFAVTPAGSQTEVVVFNPIAVEAGQLYTVVALGTLEATDNFDFSVRVFIDNDAGDAFADLSPLQKSFINVVHASPDAPAVDLLVDNNLAGSGLTFPNSTGYLDVAAGTRNIKVNVSNTSTTVIEADLDLTVDTYYSVFAIDSVANISALVLQDDLTAPAAGNAHVRFVHLSPNAPTVDITLTDGTVVFGDYEFKEASAFTPLAAATYDLQVRLAGSDTVVLDLPGIALADGNIYTVFARGFVGGDSDAALGAQIILNAE